MNEYLPQIIGTAIALVTGMLLRLIIKSLIRKFASITGKLESRTNHIIRVCGIIINSTCVLTLILIWGVDPRNLFVALSSIFAVIGVAMFAQWSILSNITAGIIIFFNSPFKIGDYIRIMDKENPVDVKVEGIFSFYTHLRTKDGELRVIPNSLLLQKEISVGGYKNIGEDDLI